MHKLFVKLKPNSNSYRTFPPYPSKKSEKGANLLLALVGFFAANRIVSRPLRIEYRGAWYYIMNRGRPGEPIFTDKRESRESVELLQKTAET